tara:strand:- start:522 stop:836 length:315 start_codon:yes stop_codon:yes gene_type:complete
MSAESNRGSGASAPKTATGSKQYRMSIGSLFMAMQLPGKGCWICSANRKIRNRSELRYQPSVASHPIDRNSNQLFNYGFTLYNGKSTLCLASTLRGVADANETD